VRDGKIQAGFDGKFYTFNEELRLYRRGTPAKLDRLPD